MAVTVASDIRVVRGRPRARRSAASRPPAISGVMAKTPWLLSFLLLLGACNHGENSETGPCYYSPQVEVPRADYDAAEDDGELSADECEALCNEYLDVEESGGPETVDAPECIVETVGSKLVTMECRVETGCA